MLFSLLSDCFAGRVTLDLNLAAWLTERAGIHLSGDASSMHMYMYMAHTGPRCGDELLFCSPSLCPSRARTTQSAGQRVSRRIRLHGGALSWAAPSVSPCELPPLDELRGVLQRDGFSHVVELLQAQGIADAESKRLPQLWKHLATAFNTHQEQHSRDNLITQRMAHQYILVTRNRQHWMRPMMNATMWKNSSNIATRMIHKTMRVDLHERCLRERRANFKSLKRQTMEIRRVCLVARRAARITVQGVASAPWSLLDDGGCNRNGHLHSRAEGTVFLARAVTKRGGVEIPAEPRSNKFVVACDHHLITAPSVKASRCRRRTGLPPRHHECQCSLRPTSPHERLPHHHHPCRRPHRLHHILRRRILPPGRLHSQRRQWTQ